MMLNQLKSIENIQTLKTNAFWGISVFNVFKSIKNI